METIFYYLHDPSFEGVARLLVSSFEKYAQRTRHIRNFLTKVQMKDWWSKPVQSDIQK